MMDSSLQYRSLIVLLLSLLSVAACAQSYPSKTIRMIIPAPAGGSVDAVGRTIGRHLSETFKQPVVADNRPGAGAMLASELTAKSLPDGYTVLMGTSSHAINAALSKNVSYNASKDFVEIALVATAPFILVIHPSVPANSVRELIALARAQPGKLSFASAGSGSSTHLAGELFRSMANIDILHVPYKGGGPALTELVSGQTQMMFHNFISVQPMLNAKRIRALAVTSAKRMDVLPSLPTIAESGVAGYESGYWYGVLGPAKIPEPIVTLLNQEINKIVTSKEVSSQLRGDGLDPAAGKPAEFTQVVRNEIGKWSRLSSRLTLKID